MRLCVCVSFIYACSSCGIGVYSRDMLLDSMYASCVYVSRLNMCVVYVNQCVYSQGMHLDSMCASLSH